MAGNKQILNVPFENFDLKWSVAPTVTRFDLVDSSNKVDDGS